MTKIRITKNITPAALSELYQTYNSDTTNNDIILVLPGEINRYTFGLLSNLLKLVITINSKHRISKLIITVDQDDLGVFYDQEYAYPIVSLLWNTCSFFDRNGTDIKGILKELQNSSWLIMNSLSKLKGNKYLLANVDHLGSSKGFVRLLENEKGFNDDEPQIIDNIKKILKDFVLTFNKKNHSEIDRYTGDIGAIIFELAKNTYEWGRTDQNSIDIPSSVRGVYLRFHTNDYKKLIEDYTGTPLATYFQNFEIKEHSVNEKGRIYYLEILVFDSGIGFIDKFQSNQGLSDIEIIKMCLIKNQTSSTSNLKSKKGIGLDRMLSILNKKGFLKICTDKYCVYRDLIKDEYKPVNIERLDELVLEDWNNNYFNVESNTKAQGSYLSILYPFKHN